MKNVREKPPMERREFLRNAARWAAFGGIAAVLGAAARNSRGPVADADCQRDFICRRCPLVPDCALPEARSFRSSREKEIQS